MTNNRRKNLLTESVGSTFSQGMLLHKQVSVSNLDAILNGFSNKESRSSKYIITAPKGYLFADESLAYGLSAQGCEGLSTRVSNVAIVNAGLHGHEKLYLLRDVSWTSGDDVALLSWEFTDLLLTPIDVLFGDRLPQNPQLHRCIVVTNVRVYPSEAGDLNYFELGVHTQSIGKQLPPIGPGLYALLAGTGGGKTTFARSLGIPIISYGEPVAVVPSPEVIRSIFMNNRTQPIVLDSIRELIYKDDGAAMAGGFSSSLINKLAEASALCWLGGSYLIVTVNPLSISPAHLGTLYTAINGSVSGLITSADMAAAITMASQHYGYVGDKPFITWRTASSEKGNLTISRYSHGIPSHFEDEDREKMSKLNAEEIQIIVNNIRGVL